MKFIRLGDEIIRLDLVTHIKEGAKDETLYGRSVRKTTDCRFGWLEVHFISGDVIKVEGEAANALRKILEDEIKVRDVLTTPAATPPPVPTHSHASASAHPHSSRKVISHEGSGPEPAHHRHEPTSNPRSGEEHRSGLRHGFGR
jgi:hypothetical protein